MVPQCPAAYMHIVNVTYHHNGACLWKRGRMAAGSLLLVVLLAVSRQGQALNPAAVRTGQASTQGQPHSRRLQFLPQFTLNPSNYPEVRPAPRLIQPDPSFTQDLAAITNSSSSSSSSSGAANSAAPAPQAAAAGVSAAQLHGSYRVCTSPGTCYLVPRLGGPAAAATQYTNSTSNNKAGNAGRGNNAAAGGGSWRPPRPKFSVSEAAVRSYNTMFGTINIDAKYTLGSQHYVLEGARRLLAAGSNVFKFQLRAQLGDGRNLDGSVYRGFMRIINNPLLPYKEVLDLPFKTFIFWAGQLPSPGRPVEYSDIFGLDVYKETYDLATYLIKRYNTTGKTFMIGIWEGDWQLRNDYNRTTPPEPGRVADMIGLLSTKQQAVDNAKADHPHSNVFVWSYTEANIVWEAMQNPQLPTMASKVLPNVRPALDYLSFSVAGNLLREVDPSRRLHQALDFLEARLPRKKGVPGTRVIIGEWGFPLTNSRGVQVLMPQEQSQRALWTAASALAWGTPIALWWELYNNEVVTSPDGFAIHRGFWLVDFNGNEQPLFKAMRSFYSAAQDFVRTVSSYSGCPPNNYAFRRWAVGQLVELAGLPMELPPPGPVRDRGAADVVPPGVRGSFVTPQCKWRCSSQDCPPVPDNESPQGSSSERGTPWTLDPAFYGSVDDPKYPPAQFQTISMDRLQYSMVPVLMPLREGESQRQVVMVNPLITQLSSVPGATWATPEQAAAAAATNSGNNGQPGQTLALLVNSSSTASVQERGAVVAGSPSPTSSSSPSTPQPPPGRRRPPAPPGQQPATTPAPAAPPGSTPAVAGGVYQATSWP